MARPARDVNVARRVAGLRIPGLATASGISATTLRRLERAVTVLGSTGEADALITQLPTLDSRAQFLLRSRIRRGTGRPPALGMSGLAGNWIQTPNTPLLTAASVGDLDVRFCGRSELWPGTNQTLMDMGGGSSWYWYTLNNGTIGGGFTIGAVNKFVTAPLTLSPIAEKWMRFTRPAATGLVQFYTSLDNGLTWVAIGTPQATAAGALDTPTSPLSIGRSAGGVPYFQGPIKFAEVRNGIDGPVVARLDTSKVTPTGPRLPVTFPVEPQNLFTANEASVESSLPALFVGESATGTSSWDATTGFDGTHSVLLTAATPSGGRASFDVHPAGPPAGYFNVTAGQAVTFICHCKGVALIKPFNGKINFSTNVAFVTSVSGSNPNNSLAAWTKHVVNTTVPATATRAAPGCDIRSSVNGDMANFDGFAFYLGTETGYRPPGDVWTMNGTGWAWVEAA